MILKVALAFRIDVWLAVRYTNVCSALIFLNLKEIAGNSSFTASTTRIQMAMYGSNTFYIYFENKFIKRRKRQTVPV